MPPELVFDAGFGELFIVRVAGNVISAEIMGTLQYAGMHLHTPLFVVMGHSGCGAVGAALATKEHGASHPDRIALLLESIYPALENLDRDAAARRSCSMPPSKPTCAGRCARCWRRRKPASARSKAS